MAPVETFNKSDLLTDSRRPSSDDSPKSEKLKEQDLENQGYDPTSATVQSDSEESVGRQIELEAENSIKYRTCSWQKVGGRYSTIRRRG